MKKVASGEGATDFGVIEKQAREFLGNAAGDQVELPLESSCHGFGGDSKTPSSITREDLIELIHAEWAGAVDRGFPWWIPAAADKIMARIECR